jgi:hypothetical protein
MSCALYYSNHCKHCKELLLILAKSKLKEEVHFICIDRRISKNNAIYIQLENGQELLLPPNIIKVPSLLLLNRGHRVLTGNEINSYLIQQNVALNIQATNNNGEPLAFSMNDFGNVVSDNYSFLDQSSDELSAKGNGGMRQIHNYAALNYSSNIETPPDTYTPDKIGGASLDQIVQQRNKDIPRQQPRM